MKRCIADVRVILFALLGSLSITSAETRVAVVACGEGTQVATDLLEQRLSTKSGIKLVDRALLATLANEQALTRIAGNDRATRAQALSEISLADAIIVVRAGEKGAVTVTLCDTRRGLRLMNRTFSTQQLQSATELIADEAWKRMAVLNQDALQLWAVPPLVDKNVDFKRAHLTRSLSRLFEESLQRHGRVLVVELAEAQALANEIALGGEDVRRSLPYYVVGEFRHDGLADDAKVTLSIGVQQGSRTVKTFERKAIAQNDIAGTVETLTADAMKAVGLANAAAADPAVEAKTLASRAETFSVVNLNDEPIELIESAILLQPEDVRLRWIAMEVYLRKLNDLREKYAKTSYGKLSGSGDGTVLIEAIATSLRAHEHLCQYVHRKLDDRAAGARPLETDIAWRFSTDWLSSDCTNSLDPKVREAFSEMMVEKRERVIPLVAHEIAVRGDSQFIDDYHLWHAPSKAADAREDLYLRVMTRLPGDHRPGDSRYADGMARLMKSAAGLNWSSQSGPSKEVAERALSRAESLIGKVESLPQKNAPIWAKWLRQCAAEWKADYEASLTSVPPRAPTSDQLKAPEAIVRAESINIQWPTGIKDRRYVPLWIDINPTLSFAQRDERYAWVEKGQAKLIDALDGAQFIAWDDRYLWLTRINAVSGHRELITLDPLDRVVRQTDVNDSLPPFDRFEAVALSQGRVLVVAMIGESGVAKRTWFATLIVRADDTPSIDVFFEAREREPESAGGSRQPKPSEAFTPGTLCALTVSNPEGDRHYVWVSPDRLVDIEQRTVRTTPRVFNLGHLVAYDGKFWGFKTPGRVIDAKQKLQWVCLEPPEFNVRPVVARTPLDGSYYHGVSPSWTGTYVISNSKSGWIAYVPGGSVYTVPFPKNTELGPYVWWSTVHQCLVVFDGIQGQRLFITLPKP